ncbi:MAG: response regulator [Vicinamibacterales bacterium]
MATHTLLVADDSQTVHRILEMACAGESVDVVTAVDGDLAIARIAEHPPDIVLADIEMPKRNGYEVAEFVRGRADLAHIPVLLMSGMFGGVDEDRVRALGAEVLVKPLKPGHVISRVKHLLQAQDQRESVPRQEVVELPRPESVEVPQPEPVAVVQPDIVENAAVAPAAVPGPATTAEDYFSRLDAAFKSLERPLARAGDPAAAVGGDGAAGASEPVPTLQELLNRLPEASRSRLTASASSPESTLTDRETSTLDAIAARVVEHLARRDDLLTELARRIAHLQTSDRRP